MPNDIKLGENHPVDANLRPITVGGELSAIETASQGNGAKITGNLTTTGNLEVIGDVYANNTVQAGTIIGYTVIGLGATPASYDVTNSILPVHDDLKVSFIFPASGNVEIFASIFAQTDIDNALTFGLSTTNASTGFTSLNAQYENHVLSPDETDGIQISHRWYVSGTAGATEELWLAAGAGVANRFDLFWGGDTSAMGDSTHPMEYQPFVMKAIALPETVYTG